MKNNSTKHSQLLISNNTYYNFKIFNLIIVYIAIHISQKMSKPKDIKNIICYAAVLLSLSEGYSLIGKKLLKFFVGNPSRDYETILINLVMPVSLSAISWDWLVTQDFFIKWSNNL